MDDVKSNGGEDGELKLREARLEFRGSKKEGSEVGVEMGKWVVAGGSKVSAGGRLGDARES